jgi:hypothetical protein
VSKDLGIDVAAGERQAMPSAICAPSARIAAFFSRELPCGT